MSAGSPCGNFPLRNGFADYLLFVDRQAIGVVEAKADGHAAERRRATSRSKYSVGLPARLPAWRTPLPFLYESTGVETLFTNELDPEPRSRHVFAFHRPETLADWVQEPSTLRARLRHAAADDDAACGRRRWRRSGTWSSRWRENRPRALIQMATGSGKTFTAVNAIYRLIKFAGAGACCSWWTAATWAPDPQGVPAIRHARRRPQVHRAVQRPAPAIEHASTRSAGSASPPSSGSTRC